MSSSRSENDTLPARPSDHVDSTERGSGDVGLGWQGWLRWGWRQLTSMRTALILLLLMAIAAIVADIGFDIEAIWNTVSGVIAPASPSRRTPKPPT